MTNIASKKTTKTSGTTAQATAGANAPAKAVVSKVERDQRSALGRAESTRAKRTKEFAYDFEKTNRAYLLLYRSTNGWWKMGGVSALYFANTLARRLKNYRTPTLKPDSDFYHKFETGVISLKDADKLVQRLETELKLDLVKKTEYTRIVSLGYKLTSAELERLKGAEQQRRATANQIVLPKQMYPDLYFNLDRAYVDICRILLKMPKSERDLLGNRIEQLGHQALMTYYHLANGELDLAAGLKSVIFGISEMIYALKELVDVGVLEHERMMRVSELLLTARDVARRAFKRLNNDASVAD